MPAPDPGPLPGDRRRRVGTRGLLLRWALVLAIAGVIAWNPIRERIAGFDRQWCRAAVSASQPVLIALEKYRAENGRYPASFSQLVPRYLQAIPSVPEHSRNDRIGGWFYQALDDQNYEFGCTAMHWVSSFDVLLYRSGAVYPPKWREGYTCFEEGGWLYVVGGSSVFKSEARSPDTVTRK